MHDNKIFLNRLQLHVAELCEKLKVIINSSKVMFRMF